ncbi:hypothetical protein BJ085DRAFT_35018 [Dimargaris cristalligena]|uniref:DUF202 domain-containing protein n=1 Tax=Dimargaris cristalligena TaxID=215637 RepID=A0A4Q0A2I0_9FUNG|nr:hypothetical protein BJ085DRAFT_35018 [Dimargaris cristalligena]|eukprot:RKP39380.1 hypothetical protein BJ085DRAFT_35018 [Dimargaris cristalligena]
MNEATPLLRTSHSPACNLPSYHALPHELSVVRDHLSYERTFLSFFRLSLTASVLGAALYLQQSSLPLDPRHSRTYSLTWLTLGLSTFVIAVVGYLVILRQYWVSVTWRNDYPLAFMVLVGSLAIIFGLSLLGN